MYSTLKRTLGLYTIGRALLLLALLGSISACSSMYYGAMEKFGYQKRDILVSRVDKAKEAQEETKEEFASALDAYLAVVELRDSELEVRYRTLLEAYERSKAQAEELAERIDAVESVAQDLFDEWSEEITQYSNRSLAAASTRQLEATKARYRPMMRTMRNAQRKVDPVLTALYDQVLYLKHNLNAQAIQAIQQEVTTVQTDVATLVRDMERSIAEAERFIAEMRSS